MYKFCIDPKLFSTLSIKIKINIVYTFKAYENKNHLIVFRVGQLILTNLIKQSCNTTSGMRH